MVAEAPRLSEERFRAALENLREGCQIIDTEWRYLYLNPAAARHGQSSVEALIGRTMMEAYPGIETTPTFAVLRECMESRGSKTIENFFELPDGTAGCFEIVIQPVPEGLFVRSLDITERKHAETALRESEARFNAFMDASPALTWIKDESGRYSYVNKGIADATGVNASAWLGKTQSEVIGGTEADDVRRGDREVLERNEPTEKVEETRVGGETRFWNAFRFPFVSPDGKRSVGGVAVDITARMEAETALRDTEARLRVATTDLEQRVRERTAELLLAKERAEAAGRAKSDFLSSMSHELRTPLNGIIGFAEFMIDGKPGPLNPKQKEYLGDVLASGRHLLQLINDLLDLSKVEAGKMRLYPDVFQIAGAIDEVCAVMKPLAQPKNIIIATIIEPSLDVVTLDEQKFKQVLYNLVSNAVKFTGDGGRVVISAAPRDGSHFALTVADSGVGIKDEDMARLFTDFEQLDDARPHGGTGLGLALTRRLVELHGGSIGVSSEFGKGSAFTVVLPFSIEGASA
ncbi:MAG TPA: PAS domain-containing protein [Thermoanaerobaculia bacterium]|nr:PAS domain-containing protein [Thermoanaerobaculia bacterium]